MTQRHTQDTVQPMSPSLLDIHQAATLLGVSKSFLYINAKRLPHFPIGSDLRFSAADLLQHFQRKVICGK